MCQIRFILIQIRIRNTDQHNKQSSDFLSTSCPSPLPSETHTQTTKYCLRVYRSRSRCSSYGSYSILLGPRRTLIIYFYWSCLFLSHCSLDRALRQRGFTLASWWPEHKMKIYYIFHCLVSGSRWIRFISDHRIRVPSMKLTGTTIVYSGQLMT